MISTIKHLCYELKTKEPELKNIIHNLRDYYSEQKKVKMKEGYPQIKDGIKQTRTVHASRWQLKDIQKRILKNILSKLLIPTYAYGSIEKRNNIMNAKQHREGNYFFMVDLEKFFPTITNNMVFEMFTSFQFSHEASRRLTQLTTYKHCLPQGPPPSPMIANLVFTKTGKKLQEFASKNNLVFTTFLDDLTFSSTEDFESKLPQITQILKEDSYKISLYKTVYTNDDPIITGILIKDKRLQLSETYKMKLLNPVNYTIEQREAYKRYFDQVEAANDN